MAPLVRMALWAALIAGCGRSLGGEARPVARATAPPSPPAASTLDDLLGRDIAADRAVPWSAQRPLAWSDFQGAPPKDGPAGAMTAYTLYYAWKCSGHEFEFRAVAGFRPRDSWVKAVILDDPLQRRSALTHEQTHFDLSELHARRMRQYFARIDSPCRRPDDELDAQARRFIDEEKGEQRRYDAATGNGVRDEPQAAWTADVARRLTGLARYAR